MYIASAFQKTNVVMTQAKNAYNQQEPSYNLFTALSSIPIENGHVFMKSDEQTMPHEVEFENFYTDALVNRHLPLPNTCFSTQSQPCEQIRTLPEVEMEYEDNYSSDDRENSPKKKWLPAGKKADKSDPELIKLSNTYFWERRNILLQMLESYPDDNAILITATAKSFKKAGGKGYVRRPRGSQYRGVSKNKSKWQVMIMGNFKKMYFGAIENEAEAALFYDKLAIVSHGIKARTNFNYTRRDIISILNDEALSRVWNE
jgi:hypothetical protein